MKHRAPFEKYLIRPGDSQRMIEKRIAGFLHDYGNSVPFAYSLFGNPRDQEAPTLDWVERYNRFVADCFRDEVKDRGETKEQKHGDSEKYVIRPEDSLRIRRIKARRFLIDYAHSLPNCCVSVTDRLLETDSVKPDFDLIQRYNAFVRDHVRHVATRERTSILDTGVRTIANILLRKSTLPTRITEKEESQLVAHMNEGHLRKESIDRISRVLRSSGENPERFWRAIERLEIYLSEKR
jgi:hypothetical protein